MAKRLLTRKKARFTEINVENRDDLRAWLVGALRAADGPSDLHQWSQHRRIQRPLGPRQGGGLDPRLGRGAERGRTAHAALRRIEGGRGTAEDLSSDGTPSAQPAKVHPG